VSEKGEWTVFAAACAAVVLFVVLFIYFVGGPI
jgi:hypothetical protein